MAEARSMTVAQIAERVGGTLEGDGTKTVTVLLPLHQAGPDAISWVGSTEYLKQAATSKAAALIIPKDSPPLEGKTVIRVDDPDVAMIAVLEALAPPMDRVEPGIHPSAVIGEGAKVDGAAIGPHVVVGARSTIGAGTQLHAGASIGSDVIVGTDCVLWSNVVVRERITIGDRVIIHANSTIGADGFSYVFREGVHKKVPQIGTVVIEDDVEIGANSAVDRARSGETRIGKGTKLDNFVTVGHNVQIGEHCVIVAQCGLGGSAVLGDYCVLGGQVALIDHRTVGKGVQIACKSLVSNTIPDGQIIRGNPAIENPRFVREQAAARKLPEALKQLRALAKRVEELETKQAETG